MNTALTTAPRAARLRSAPPSGSKPRRRMASARAASVVAVRSEGSTPSRG